MRHVGYSQYLPGGLQQVSDRPDLIWLRKSIFSAFPFFGVLGGFCLFMTRCKQWAHLLPTPFWTCFPLLALNFLLHSTSSTLAGYYPTLTPILATIERMLSTIYDKKTDKKALKKVKKGDKFSEALFLRQPYAQTGL